MSESHGTSEEQTVIPPVLRVLGRLEDQVAELADAVADLKAAERPKTE